MVRIEFEKTYNDMTFRDAITLPDDHGLTEADIAAMMQQRFDNWVAIITAPPPEPAADAEPLPE